MDRRVNKQNGFAMIEVLVTAVIMAVGLLGLATLQTVSMKYSQGAYLRSQASILAYDMFDRMRANRNQVLAGNYDISVGSGPSGSTNCDTTVCSASDTAQFDLNYWKCSLGNWDASSVCSGTLAISGLLPSGDGTIASNNGIYTVTIQWLGRDGEQSSFQISSEI